MKLLLKYVVVAVDNF